MSTNGSVSPKRGPGEVSVHGGLPDREVEACRSPTAQGNCIPPNVFPVGNPRRFTPFALSHQLGPGGHNRAERRTKTCRESA